MKAYIEYGWPEGKWHGKLLTKSLIASGYVMATSSSEADIIIAHSAGCYMIPPDSKAKVMLLIGIPNWPKNLFINALYRKLNWKPKMHIGLRKHFSILSMRLGFPLPLERGERSSRKASTIIQRQW